MTTKRTSRQSANEWIAHQAVVGLLTLCMVIQLVPTQSIAYAREQVYDAVMQEGSASDELTGAQDYSQGEEAFEGDNAPENIDAAEEVSYGEPETTTNETDTTVDGDEVHEDAPEVVYREADRDGVEDEPENKAEDEPENGVESQGEDEADDKSEDEVHVVSQTANVGGATITVEYDSDAFDTEVTLQAEAVATSEVEGSLDELADARSDFDWDCARAFDITFVRGDGSVAEPIKPVSVSIELANALTSEAVATNLVHIDDSGNAELVEDASVADDGRSASFEGDAFSIYVVTAAEGGNVVVGDAYYKTLAEALEAASDGDTINIVGTTEDTDSVAVDKSVTILSDGADGSLPKGLDINDGTVTLGGGSNMLTMGAVWIYGGNQTTIANNVHITGSLPLYVQSDGTKLLISGGKVEQTVARSNWNCAVGVYQGSVEMTGGEIVALGDGIYNASIESISGGTITAGQDGINNANVESVSGGTITAGRYGIYLAWNNVGEISGGEITAEDHAIFFYYGSEIDKISGGRFESKNGSALYTGDWSDDGKIGEISGGTFIGQNAISGESLEQDTVAISGGVFKASSDSADAIGSGITVDFTNGVDSVRWIGALHEDKYTVPAGYAPSTDTVKVSGVDGDFHFFALEFDVTYDGNGGKTSNGKTQISRTATGSFTTIENDFVGPNNKVFKEWNTEADGNGTAYAEGVVVTANQATTLYAIWEVAENAVSIGETYYANIADAMAAAHDGDTIVVHKNVSDAGNIVVDKDVTIVAGDKNVTSVGADLKVSAGKSLTLGSGSTGSVLTMKGTTSVTNGHVTLRDGVSLRNTLDLNGDGATGTITGGEITVSSGCAIKLDGKSSIDKISGGHFFSSGDHCVTVFTNAKITSIAGGTFVSTKGQGMDLYGAVGTISGENTTFKGSGCGIYVRRKGAISTIDNGQFISTTTNSYSVHAGLFVQGKCATINGGTFTGSQGAQFGNTTDSYHTEIPANAGVAINGGTFHGIASYGIDFVANNSATKLECSIKNATIISDDYYALDINGGYHFSEISPVTVSGADGGLFTMDLGRSSTSLDIDSINSGTFSSMHIGRDTHVPEITGVTVTGNTQLGAYNGDRATIGTVSNSSFEGSVNVVKADIVTFENVTIANGLRNTDDGAIGTITGAGTRIEGSYATPAIENEGEIGTIAAGTFVGQDDGDGWTDGTEHALYNHGSDASVGMISGGAFTSTYSGDGACYALANEEGAAIGSITAGSFTSDKSNAIKNSATITSIDAAKEGDLVVTGNGGAAVLNDGGTIGAIKGHGIYVGKDNAIKLTGGTVNLEPDLANGVGMGRYQTSSNTQESQLDGVTVPTGYHISKATTTVAGQDGAFHYLVKENTIIYKGNGHKLEKGEGADDETFLKVSNVVADNSYDTDNDFQFAENGIKLVEWNTEADGSGTAYKPGDTANIAEGEELVLYAQWVYFYEVAPANQKVEGTGKKFAYLQDAINATTAETPLVLTLHDHEETTRFTVPQDKTVIMDVVEGVTLTVDGWGSVQGSLEINNGINVVTSSNNAAIDVVGGKGVFTMNGGRLASSGNYGLHVDRGAKVTAIAGGLIEGTDGIYCNGEIGSISGGIISGTLNHKDHGSSLKLASGSHVDTISGGTFNTTGDAHAIYVWSTNGSSPTVVDNISGGTFTAGSNANVLYIYGNSQITTISGGTFTGGTCLWVWPMSYTGLRNTVTGGQFNADNDGGSAVYLYPNADVEILGGTFTGYKGIINAGKIESIQNAIIVASIGIENASTCGSIKKTRISATSGDAICNTSAYLSGTIASIEDSTLVTTAKSGACALRNSYPKNTVGSITGSTLTSAGDYAIVNAGTISQVGDGTVVKGGTAAISNAKNIGHVAGSVVLVGGEHAIVSGSGATLGLEDAAPYDLTAADAPMRGFVRYQTADGNSAVSQLEGVTVPTGYHMSQITVPVEGQEGEFHFLVKDGSIVYKGNGHKLERGAGIDEWTFLKPSAVVADNSYATESDFEFNDGNLDFIGWNTEANGSGTAYKPGDTASIAEGEELVLYAQWEGRSYTVAFDANGGQGTMPNQKIYFDETKALAANTFTYAEHEFVGWNTKPNGSGKSYADMQEVKNAVTWPNRTITLYAQWREYTITVNHYLDLVVNEDRGFMSITGGPYELMRQYHASRFTVEDLFTRMASDDHDLDVMVKKDASAPLAKGCLIEHPYTKRDYHLVSVKVNGVEVDDLTTVSYQLDKDYVVSFEYEIVPVELTVHAASYQGVYDGEEHTASGFKEKTEYIDGYGIKSWITYVEEASDERENYRIDLTKLTPNCTRTNVGSDVVGPSLAEANAWQRDADGSYIIPYGAYSLYYGYNKVYNLLSSDAFDKCFTVKLVPGDLTITSAPLTVTAKDQAYTYNGAAQGENNVTYHDAASIANRVSVEGLKGTDALTSVTLDGSATDAGEYVGKLVASDAKIGASTDNYTIGYKPGKLTINASDALTVEPVAGDDKESLDASSKTITVTYDGAAHEVGAKASVEGAKIEFSTSADGEAWSDWTTAAPSLTDAGSLHFKVRATKDNYQDAEANGWTLTVEPKAVTVTAQSHAFAYDGTEHAWPQYDVSGLVGPDKIEAVVSGSITHVKQSPVTNKLVSYEFVSGKAANYQVTTADGHLTMTNAEREITITAATQSWTYDGQAHTNSTVTLTKGELFTGDTLEARAEGSVCNVADTAEGNNPVAAGYKIMHGDEDVTASYAITANPGTLSIVQRTVNASVGDAEAEYNGSNWQGLSEVAFSGLVGDHKASIAYTPAVGMLPGEYYGSFDNATLVVKAGQDDVTANYRLGTLTPGKLTITDRAVPYGIELTPASGTATYTGAEQSVTGFEHTAFVVEGNTYTVVDARSSAKGTDAGSYPVQVDLSEARVLDAQRNNVTSQFALTASGGSKLVIEPKAATVTTGSATKAYDGTALVSSQAGIEGLVEGETATVRATGAQTEVGSSTNGYDLTWGTAKAGNYTLSEKLGTLTVEKNGALVTLTAASDEKVYDGTPLTNAKVTATGQPQGLKVEAKAAGSQTAVGSSANTVAAGWKIVDVQGADKTANFTNVKTVDGTLKVTPKALTNGDVSVEAPSDVTYTGKSQQQKPTITDAQTGKALVEGVDYELAYTSDTTNAGTVTVTVTGKGNYAGELKTSYAINRASYHVTTSSASKTYDGAALASADAQVVGLVNGETATVTATGSRKNVGTVENAYTLAWDGTAQEGNYVHEVKADQLGTLTVAKRSVTLTSASAEKTYDGKVLTSDRVVVGSDGWAAGEGAVYSVTGSQKVVGSSQNSFTYELNEGTKASNYDVVTIPGTLTVTSRDAKYAITVEGESLSATYDGTEHGATGLKQTTFDVDGNAYTVSGLDTDDPRATNAGTYANGVTGTAVVRDADGTDVSDQFAVSVKSGQLTIARRNVSLSSASASKAYDGTALTDATISVGGDGWVAGEGATFDVTGNQKLPGSSNNAFTYQLNEGTLAANYNVTTSYGTLTVTDRTTPYGIELAPNDGTATYDGAEHGVAGLKQTAFDVDGNTYTVVGVVASAKGTNAGSYPAQTSLASARVLDADGNDVTSQFVLTVADGHGLVIAPKDVMVAANNASKTYGEPDPELSATVAGVLDGESVVFDLTRVEGEGVGTYAITAVGDADQGNYRVSFEGGSLTIVRAQMSLDVEGYSGPYDGQPHTLQKVVPSVTEGTILTYSTDGGISWQAGKPSITEVGTLKVLVRATNPNYEVAIAEATLTVTEPVVPTTPVTPTTPETPTTPNTPATPTVSTTSGTPANPEPASAPAPETPAIDAQGEAPDTTPAVTTDAQSETTATTEEVSDEPIPQAAPVAESIDDNANPLTGGAQKDFWALINLLAAIVTTALCLIRLLGLRKQKREDDEERDNELRAETDEQAEDDKRLKNRKMLRLMSLLPAVASIVLFILTEDMSKQMVMADRWTLWMLALLVVQVVLFLLARNKEQDKDQDQNQGADLGQVQA